MFATGSAGGAPSRLVFAPRVHTGSQWLEPGWVAMADGHVLGVGAGVPPGTPDVTLADGVLAPGLVDLQLNGAWGHDLANASEAGWAEVVTALPSTGTTSVVPTVITAPADELVGSVRRYAALRPDLDEIAGAARTLGLHVEGPFLADRRRGAHSAAHLVRPDPRLLDALIAAGGGRLAYVTLAPELEGGLDAVRRLVGAGVRVAIGHSDATEAQALAAADAGATMVTHLFNAQRPLHHREPGIVGAALIDHRFTAGLIADGHHVAASALLLAFAAAPGRIALVSDATASLGMEPGRYRLGDSDVVVTSDGPPLRIDGTIAGSSLRLDDAVSHASACGVELGMAIAAATRVPADALGHMDIGRIAVGARADLVHLGGNGARLRAQLTWIGGELAWQAST